MSLAAPDPLGGERPRFGVRVALATGLGVGVAAPVAAGTFGSALGLGLFWLVSAIWGWPATVAAAVLATAIGFWSAGAAERYFGREDPGPVVIDEIAGQIATLLFLPPTIPVLTAGFFLFRILDIFKPFPARRLEALPGGSGIMADDLMVALYANLALQIATRLFPSWLGVA